MRAPPPRPRSAPVSATATRIRRPEQQHPRAVRHRHRQPPPRAALGRDHRLGHAGRLDAAVDAVEEHQLLGPAPVLGQPVRRRPGHRSVDHQDAAARRRRALGDGVPQRRKGPRLRLGGLTCDAVDGGERQSQRQPGETEPGGEAEGPRRRRRRQRLARKQQQQHRVERRREAQLRSRQDQQPGRAQRPDHDRALCHLPRLGSRPTQPEQHAEYGGGDHHVEEQVQGERQGGSRLIEDRARADRPQCLHQRLDLARRSNARRPHRQPAHHVRQACGCGVGATGDRAHSHQAHPEPECERHEAQNGAACRAGEEQRKERGGDRCEERDLLGEHRHGEENGGERPAPRQATQGRPGGEHTGDHVLLEGDEAQPRDQPCRRQHRGYPKRQRAALAQPERPGEAGDGPSSQAEHQEERQEVELPGLAEQRLAEPHQDLADRADEAVVGSLEEGAVAGCQPVDRAFGAGGLVERHVIVAQPLAAEEGRIEAEVEKEPQSQEGGQAPRSRNQLVQKTRPAGQGWATLAVSEAPDQLLPSAPVGHVFGGGCGPGGGAGGGRARSLWRRLGHAAGGVTGGPRRSSEKLGCSPCAYTTPGALSRQPLSGLDFRPVPSPSDAV